MNDKASNGETEASDSPAASAEAKTPPPPIVGVGASAGGVTALQELVEHIPADSGIAWVLIQHMPPHRPSELTGILARRTEVPVTEVDEDTAVEADHIYVLGPGQVMTIQDEIGRASC